MEKEGGGAKLSPTLSDLVQCEVSRILKGEQPEQVNFAHISDFAGNICLILILILACLTLAG